MFCFGGRKANLELQLPFIRRILAEHPGMAYHLWDTAKDPADRDYIRSLKTRRNFKVLTGFADMPTGKAWNAIYRHYAEPEYKGKRFIKLDDDVVFIQTGNLIHFIDAIDANSHAVVSANVINNGACMMLDPLLRERFKRLRMPQLNVHLHPEFAEMSHDYFLREWRQVIERPVQWTPTRDWLSINFIGYDHNMARKFSKLLDTQSPRVIAGRPFRGRDKLGDEGMVNTLPRIIADGFTVAHLTFGPQERKDPAMFTELRKRYAEIGKEYLKR